MRTERTRQVAILVHHLGNPFEASLVAHVEAYLAEHECSLLLHTYGHQTEEEILPRLVERIDGLLLLGQSLSDSTIALYAERQIPIVSILQPAWEKPEIASADLDWLRAMRKVVAYLQERGHTSIGFMTNGNPAHYHTRRFSAFIQAMQLCNGKFDHDHVISGGGTFLKAYDALEQYLRGRALTFTALVCANDLMAIGALAACRDCGVRVPEQLAVIGCEDILMSSETSPSLTTIQYARDTLARGAVDMLLAKLNGEEASPSVVEGNLLIRSSG